MEKIIYVTGNKGKKVDIKFKCEQLGLDVDFYDYDFEEPDVNDIEFISKSKALKAYEILKNPCFVADSGFFIEAYPNNSNYPGAFVKRSGISSNISKLLDDMKDVKNRNCKFVDCLTFYDGIKFCTFYGVSSGRLATEIRGTISEKIKSNLWFVFIPDNCLKTLAEMTDFELKNRLDGRTSATTQFLNWYKNEYLPQKNCKVYKKY